METNSKFQFYISPEIRKAAPDYTLIAIMCSISNPQTSDELWECLEGESLKIRNNFAMEDIRHIPAIDYTRRAYKTLGKEPNRYRPSAEALARRSVKGLDLYRTLSAIDLVNLISLKTGISIGAFDADKIVGDSLTLSRGIENEPYEAIGRGQLNIGGLPVWRDKIGGIGTPTSDNERTKLTSETKNLLLTVNVYHPIAEFEQDTLISEIIKDLNIWLNASDITVEILKST